KIDFRENFRDVRFSTFTTISAKPGCPLTLFDHLVGTQQESLWDSYAERLCRCKIDDQLESGRLFDRKVGGLCPLQNLVDEVGCTPEQVGRLGSVTHKASRSKKLTERVGRR